MEYLEFYCKENQNGSDDIEPVIRKKDVESYYNISWVNNERYINFAFQDIKKYKEANSITDNMSEEQVIAIRNYWKNTVSKLRFRSIPHWSVKQRKLPLIANTELYIKAGFNHLIDKNLRNIIHWGSNNHIAVIVNQVVRIIHFDNFKRKKSFDHNYEIQINNSMIGVCLRWNRKANYIAIAAQEKEIEVWDPKIKKCQYSYRCKCEVQTCRIESMEWSKSDKLLSGCSNGCLCIFNKNLESSNFDRIHDGAIIKIMLSSKDYYLATSGTDCIVKIWTMPGCCPFYTFKCIKPVKAIAWHPWTEHHFVIGGYTDNNLITLWNAKKVDSLRKLQSIPKSGTDIFTVKNLTFNSFSGELVVNYAVSQRNSSNACRDLIFVYSNLLSMVDIIHWHKASILYLLWNNDGSKLVSMDIFGKGAIWDFLGNRDETFIKPEPYFTI